MAQAEEVQNYLRILEAVPTNVPAFEALKKIFTESESWEDLAKLYLDRADRLPDRSQTTDLYLQAAALFLHRLQDYDGAKQAITKVLEHNPNHTQALSLWRQLSMEEGDYATAIKILRQESQQTEDPQEKSKIFTEIARLFANHLDNDEHAAVAFHQAFLLDQSNEEAMNEALRLYKSVQQWQRVIAVLRARLEHVEENTDKARLLFQIAQIVQNDLEEGKTPEGLEKAGQLYKEALGLDPEYKDAEHALEALAYEMEEWTTLLKRLKKEIRQAKGDSERAAFINYKIADGYYRREGKPAYAIRYCKQALELHNGHEPSLELLQKLYAELGKWEALSDFLMDQTKQSDEPEHKVHWFKKLASLYREHTKELEREVGILEQILELIPTELDTLQRLEGIYREESRFGKTLDIMEKRLDILEGNEEKRDLLTEMAVLAHIELKRSEQAAQYYESILELFPEDIETIDALLPLYEGEAQWEKLIEGLQRKLQHVEEKQLRGELLTRIGDIYNQRLSLSKEAFETYTQAIRENPQDDELTQKLESLARQMGNWSEMIELYRTTLEQSEDEADRSALLYRIGDIYERELGDMDSARQSYQEAIEEFHYLNAIDALLRIYRQSGDWVELAELLSEKAQLEQVQGEERISVLQDLASIREVNIEDAPGAAEAFEAILELDATHGPSLESLERLYKQMEDWENLRLIYQKRIEDPRSEDELKSTLHILGSLLLERLGELDAAVQIFQQLRVLDPHNNVILTRLDQLYRELGQWDLWVETAHQRVENIRRPDQKREVLSEIASIQENELEDAQAAIATLRQIHELQPTEVSILDELLRLLDAQALNEETHESAVEGQLEILRKKTDLSEDTATKKELLFRMAKLFRQQQREEEMASTFREVQDLDPKDLNALRALQAYYQLQGDHEAVLDLLLQQRQAVEDEETRTQLSQRIAQLQTALGQYHRAIDEYRAILEQNPEDAAARMTLEEIASEQERWRVDAMQVLEPIYRQSSDWEALVNALEARFTAIDDKRQRLEVARELEELYRLQLADDEKAFQWSCQLLREDFEDPEIRERVELMADEMEQWDDLLLVYEDIVRTFVDPSQIIETYLFIAQNYQDRLSRSDDALRNYRRVLDYDNNNLQAIDALEELYRELEKWRDLVDILRMRVKLSEDADEKKELLFEVAHLWEEQLDDSAEAIQVFGDILELDNNELKAIRSLAGLFQKENHHSDLAELWERELGLLEDEEEINALRYNLGQLYSEHLNNHTRSLDLFREVLEADPEHTQAIIHVQTMGEEDAYRLTCARILEPIYLYQEDFARLKEVYKIQLEDVSQSAAERRKALMRLGRLHEERLEEHNEAFQRYLQVFKEEPGHEGTRDALLRMSEILNLWGDVVSAFELGVDKIEDLDERVQTHLVLAEIHRDRMQDPDRGMRHHRRVVDELDGKNLEAIRALEAYYNERSQWNELIAILFQKENALSDEVEKKGVFNHIASIYEEQLQDNAQSISILQQYLHRLESQADAPLPGQAELDEARANDERAEQELTMLAETVDQTKNELDELTAQAEETQTQLQDVLAQLQEATENFQGKTEALEVLMEQFDADPENEETQEQLEVVREERETWFEKREDLQSDYDQLAPAAEAAAEAQTSKEEELNHKVELFDSAEIAAAEASSAVQTAEAAMEEYKAAAFEREEQRINFQLETIRDLARLFDQEERWGDLVEIREKEIELLDDDELILERRYEVAELWEERIYDIPRAVGLYRSLLDENPDYDPALEALDRLRENDDYQLLVAESLESYFREGRQDWVRLIEMIEIQLNHTDEKARRIEFLKEIVILYEEELDNPDMAFVYLCRAFREAPTDRDIISELERLAEETDAWEELVGVYEDEVEGIEDAQLALRMYLKIANINDEALMDTEEAIFNYQKALGLEHHNSVALGALDRLYRQQKEWNSLVDILQRKVQVTEDTREQITLWSRTANIWERELNELDQAIASYREILNIDGENHSALSALQRLYQQVEQWEALYEICQRKSDLVESRSERAKLLKKMANLSAEYLGRPQEAIDFYEQVLEDYEDDEESLQALEKLYNQTERWDDLVQVVQRLLNVISGVERKKEFYRVLGYTYNHHLNDEEKSVEGWQKVLDLDPKDHGALDALRDIYERREDWPALVGILRRLIPLQVEDEETLQLYLRLASIYQHQMDQLEDAISAWRRVLELDPTHWEALETLEALLLERKDWRAVLGILEKKEVVVEDVNESIELLNRAAHICQDELREPNRATPYFERILQLDPTHLDAIRSLEGLYTRNQDWQKLIQINNLEVQLLEDPSEKVSSLLSVAQIYESKLFNKAEAFHTYIRAFECEPSRQDVREELERIADETDRWEDLVTVLLSEVEKLEYLQYGPPTPEVAEGEEAPEVEPHESVETSAVRIDLWMRLGYIQYYHLQDDPPAIHAYQKILELEANHFEAIEALEELYDQNEKWNELIEIFLKKLRLAEDLEEQKDLLLKTAELWEYQLENRGEAISAYRQLLSLEPDADEVLHSLERLYRDDQQWADLIDILQQRIARASNPQEIFEMQFEIAQVYDEELEQPQQAMEAYQHILSLDPNNVNALRALEKLYTHLENWEELLNVLTKQIELNHRIEEKVTYFYRMSIIWEEELQDHSMAIESLGKILEIDRWNLSAIKGLERLYYTAQNWNKLIEIYERHLKAVDDLEQMASLYYEIGSIYENHLYDTDRAVTYYQRVLDSDPFYQPALSALGKLYEAAENWSKCIEMMEREARVVNDPEQLVEVYYRVGKIYEERLVQIDRAKDSYRKALEFNPGYLPALRSLKVIHFLQRDWEGVIRLALQQERYTEDLEEKAGLFCEIGKLYRDRMANAQQAAAYYAKALEVNPMHIPAARPLAELYIEEEYWQHAEQVLDMLIGLMKQHAINEDLFRYHYLLALAAEKQENTQKALIHYQESYNLDPTYFPTLNGLGRLYYSQQEWERSLKVYQTILYNHRNQLAERELSEVYYRMGLAYDQMGAPDQAVEYYERALDIDPANPEALRRLAVHAEQRQEWERSLELKERLLLILVDEQERFNITMELGALCQEKIKRPQQAIDFYRQAYFIDDQNIQIQYHLLELYQECQQWYEMISTLEKMIELEPDLDKKLQYTYNIAELYQNNLQNVEQAIAYYNKVLDLNFNYEAAFAAIESLLFSLERWETLDQSYQAMLDRLPQEDAYQPKKLELWKKLGDLHRYKIGNIKNAVVAYELVYQLEPAVKNLEILAELYGQDTEYRPKAVEIHHELLRRNPARIESYKALIRLYYELQEFDQSFAVCSTLRFLRETSPEEEQFYKSMKAKAPDRLKRAFQENEVWKKLLFHANVNTPLAEILTILYNYCGADFARNAKEFKIKKSDKVDPNLFFARTYEYVSQVLGLTGREVYTTGMLPGLRIVNTYPPVILAGEDMFKERHPKELLFMIARQITFSRPEFLFASVLGLGEFKALVSSFINLYASDFPVEAPAEEAEKIKRRIAKVLPAESRDQLGRLVQSYLQDPNRITVEQFVEGIEHTANRVGFCLAGDLNISSKVCEREVREDFNVPHRTKIKELVLFSISEEYFTFRDKQGLAVSQ